MSITGLRVVNRSSLEGKVRIGANADLQGGQGSNIQALGDIQDLSLNPAPKAGSVLRYDSVLGRWVDYYLTGATTPLSDTTQTTIAQIIAAIQQDLGKSAAAIDPNRVGQAGGVPLLDTNGHLAPSTIPNTVPQLVNGKLQVSQLPDLAIQDTVLCDNESQMLGCVAQRGDLAMRRDLGGAVFVLFGDDPSILSNWIPLRSGPTPQFLVKIDEVDQAPAYLGTKIMAGANVTIDYIDLGGGNKVMRINSGGTRATTGNVPPVFNQMPTQALVAGHAFTFNLTHYVTLTDGDPLIGWAVVSGVLPDGITLNTSTGVISGTPTKTGTYLVTLAVSDKDGQSNTSILSFGVGSEIVAASYDYGTFDAPNVSAASVDFGTLTTPTGVPLDFGLLP